MAEIKVLDSDTIDKIAAGEVVERPASVVKELVENSIDAGATALTVEIKDGGIEFIRVTDNGSGIEKAYIKNAFLRHATSKIRTAEDLNSIVSLGFRGEALSSISAVSKVEIITKCENDLTGQRLFIEGGVVKDVEEVGAPKGTTMIVKNLFYNTPARRKFLKQPQTEAGYIADLMEHLALSRPDISFKLVVGSTTKFHTSGNGDLKEVIYRIYGKDFATEVIPIDYSDGLVTLQGYLGKPVLVRSNRNFELFYLNGRFIKSNSVFKSIEEGCSEYLMQHKFPFCVINMTIDCTKVDVNVHPTKMDVRFSDTGLVCETISNAIKETYAKGEYFPDGLRDDDKPQIRKDNIFAPEPFEKSRVNSFKVSEENDYKENVDKSTNDFKLNPVWSRVLSKETDDEVNELIEKVKDLREENEKKPEFDYESEYEADANGNSDADAEYNTDTEEFSFEEDVAGPLYELKTQEKDHDDQVERSAKTGNGFDDDLIKIQNPTQLNLFDERILKEENRKYFKIIGQVFDTYWIVQYEENMLIIDQHAAHEKVKYERFIKRLRENQIFSQNLMPPIIVALNPNEIDIVERFMDSFNELGFEIEHFGGNEYALRAVPIDLYGCNEKEMFLDVLDEMGEGMKLEKVTSVHDKIASMSCKAAVKGNTRLTLKEVEELVDELMGLENPYNCPHGRPTIIKMTERELEKKFKRIVD
ncbi:MAG: DNA mismatch repair endonuclease MutL [Lachnospiraceae bacterium]|nr:DNA mismatch repair endonuclease MutL [Lachnospiraceae bacterium]